MLWRIFDIHIIYKAMQTYIGQSVAGSTHAMTHQAMFIAPDATVPIKADLVPTQHWKQYVVEQLTKWREYRE